MARLLSDQPETSSGGGGSSTASTTNQDPIKTMGDDVIKTSGVTNINSNSSTNTKTTVVTPRKLSFKLRNSSASTQNRPTFRATKVTLSPNSVATLANKFNAVIIQNDAQGRALLKKLNSTSSIPKKRTPRPVEGTVRAAVQKLETSSTTNTTNRSNHDRPKLVLVRKHSSNKNSNKNKTNSVSNSSQNSINRKINDNTESSNTVDKTITSSLTPLTNKPKPKIKPGQRIIKNSTENNNIKNKPIILNKISELNKNITIDDNKCVRSKKIDSEIDKSSNNKIVESIKSKFDCDSIKSSINKDKRLLQCDSKNDKKNDRFVNESDDVFVDSSPINDKSSISNSNKLRSIRCQNSNDIDSKIKTKNPKYVTLSTNLNESVEHGSKKARTINTDELTQDNVCVNIETTKINLTEKSKHRLSLNTTINKPKIQPKPNFDQSNSIAEQSKKKLSISTPTLLNNIETKPETILNVQDKKLSLAVDQSYLESALNEFNINNQPNSNTNTIDVKSNKHIDNELIENKMKPIAKPNRSFLWRNVSNESVINNDKQNIVDEIKQKESLIIAGVKHNVATKVTNKTSLFQQNKIRNKVEQNDFDDKHIYMNGSSIITNLHEITSTLDRKTTNSNILSSNDINNKNDNEKNNDKIFIPSTKVNSRNSITTNLVQENVEEKENVRTCKNTTMYEEIENTRNTTIKTSFLYRNLYITEARNHDVIPVDVKNDTVTLNNYEELQGEMNYDSSHKLHRMQHQISSASYLSTSKSYGYVDPNNSNYEDLEDAYASIPENEDDNINNDDFSENIYDDVLNVRMAVKQLELGGGSHYESVYQAEIGSTNFDKDSDSSCDQNNSIYGITGGRPSSRASSVSYHVGIGQPTPRSETSDEWVDVDISENEEVLVYKERDRPRVRNTSAADGWCQKVRRQWSKRAGRSSPDGSDSESNAHQYESVQSQGNQPICDDFDGSLDSDSSFNDEDDLHHRNNNKKLPESHSDRTLPSIPAQNDGIYGFMKQAGKRMRKHWSIGKSLRRIRKMSVGTTTNSTTSEEPAETTNGNASLNRRRWSSFKSKFKTPSTSSGSTFYLDNDQLSSKQDLTDNCDKQSPMSATTVPPIPSRTSPSASVHSSTNVDIRRFSMSSLRPTSPPPPPPPLMQRSPANNSNNGDSPKKSSRLSANASSCYSETDTYETATNGSYSADGMFYSARSQSTVWYSDSGLWDSSHTVTADSGSEHSSSHGSDLHLRFADEPLYQFYNATVTQEELNLCYSTVDGDNDVEPLESDGYEEIGDRLISRPSAMELITPKPGHHRRLWCEIPQVRNSEILRSMTKEERKLQEAKFEVMTSEASYFKSLTVLEKHFAASPLLLDESVLTSKDRKSLFGYVLSVRKCSEKLLSSLDRCWQESIMLSGICDIIHKHALQHFQVYITYCSNQIDLNVTLRQLKETNKKFEEALMHLESDPKCESLSLHSFLMLPMQRITRMPLLVDAILSNLEVTHPEYASCQEALKTLNEFVQRCNEETRQQERVIEMVKLSRQLEFSKDVRTLPIVSKNRWLVRSGQVLQLNADTKQTFGRKFTKQGVKITLFLFNDVLLLARKKSEDSYLVIDHCQRNLIQMTEEDDIVNNSSRYLLKLAMLKNHEGKLAEMIIGCDTETCRQRWMQAVAPLTSENPGEAIYESWDCPQVVVIHSYIGVQPDELALQKGDIINVLRKMTDGWYHGERTRDGETGWFPGNHVHEIVSAHVRARNLHQRYRLLTLSGSYLQQQQQNQLQSNKKQRL